VRLYHHPAKLAKPAEHCWPAYRESLRDIDACLRAMSGKLYHMGFRAPAARSTLADANDSHDWRVYADVAQVLIRVDYCAATGAAAAGALGAFFWGFFTADFFASFSGADITAFFVAFFGAGCFATAGFSGSFAAWNAAQRFFVAAEIALLPAALIFRFRFGTSDVVAGSVRPPSSICRSSAICPSIRRFWASKPLMAAARISAVSFCVGMWVSLSRLTLHVTTIVHRRTYWASNGHRQRIVTTLDAVFSRWPLEPN
jgi:hypothetical protein